MAVVGIGIGLVMQVLVLVVQNNARPRDIGVVTSTATFFRSVGGAFGVAIFGAVFATRLADQLERFPPEIRERIGSGVHLSPAQAAELPPAVHADFLDAFAHETDVGLIVAIHGVTRAKAPPLLLVGVLE